MMKMHGQTTLKNPLDILRNKHISRRALSCTNLEHLPRLINHKGMKKEDEIFGPSFSQKSVYSGF